jgi:hypothetical protein
VKAPTHLATAIFASTLTAIFAGATSPTFAQGARELQPLATAKTALVRFENSPFPYRGEVPEKNRPFLDAMEGERRGHTSPRGGIYWEELTYSDRRSLLYIPKGFDPRRPTVIVVYFHGNEATLTRDVRTRQQVPRQVAESGLNAVLIAPQFAVDALDSSAGRFWQPGVFAQYVTEAAERLTRLYGDERVRPIFARAPVVIAAYSGGYHPAAFIVKSGAIDNRLRGVILLDGPFGDLDKFADWLARRPPAFFVSAYGKAAREDNATLQRLLTDRGISFKTGLPASMAPGVVTFVDSADDVPHSDFVTDGWGKDPLKVLLRRVSGFARTGAASPSSLPNK